MDKYYIYDHRTNKKVITYANSTKEAFKNILGTYKSYFHIESDIYLFIEDKIVLRINRIDDSIGKVKMLVKFIG